MTDTQNFPVTGPGAGWNAEQRLAAKEWFAQHRLRYAVSLVYVMLRSRGAGRWVDAEDCVFEWLSGGLTKDGKLREAPFDRMTARFDPAKGAFEGFAMTGLKLYLTGTYFPRIMRWPLATDGDKHADSGDRDQADPASAARLEEAVDLAERVFTRMEQSEWQILRDAALGSTNKEVAEALGISETNAKVRRNRAREKARKIRDELENPQTPNT